MWMPQKSDDYHPGSNTGGAQGPRQMPRVPGDLPRDSRPQDKTNYFTPSTLERDFEEEHPSSVDRGSGPEAQSGGGSQSHTGPPGRIDNIYPEPLNWLRPFKNMPIPPYRYNQDFNTGFDTEYTQRQYGKLNLREKFSKVYEKATIQLSNVPQALISEIKHLQEQISDDIINDRMDDRGWVENGLQKNFHITVLFGTTDDVVDEVKKIFRAIESPITIETDGVEYFDNDVEGTVAVVRCKSEGLESLHKELVGSIDNTHRGGDYKAHITIAYLKPDKRLSDEEFNPASWTVDELEISKSTGDIVKIPKTGKLNLRRIADDNFANIFNQGIIKTLTDPNTPEHIIFKYIDIGFRSGDPFKEYISKINKFH